MKKLFTILILIFPLLCIAQKQGNIWYFGLQAGIDFSNGTPSILSNGQTGTDANPYPQEGTACISDSSGNLLFYTGGKTIWNRNHIPMPNGIGIMGGTSSTQSSIIIPLPGSDSIFYVFTSDEYQSYLNPPQKGYRYSIVNMCLNNGYGDVIAGQKNILLLDSSTEKISVCIDGNGTGYWIVGHKMFSDEFNAWHITSVGITDTVISKIGTIHGWNNITSSWIYGAAQGEMKISPSGTKLALAISNFDPAYLDLFDFNNNTGVVSNFYHIVIDSILGKRIWGVEFSPDNTKLYATLSGGSGMKKNIYQYDITAGGGNYDSIISSRFQLFQSNNNSILFGIKLAPNGKIYLICDNNNTLSCINFPNLAALSADFNLSVLTLTGSVNYELPCFISGYNYINGIPKCSSSSINELANNNQAILYQNEPNPFDGNTVIRYFIPENTNGTAFIVFYDMYGKEIKRAEITVKGFGNINANTENLASGIYSYSIIINDDVIDTKKMLRNK